MMTENSKSPKPTPENQNTKNLNWGSYEKYDENIPSPTFRVDLKKLPYLTFLADSKKYFEEEEKKS